MTNVCFWVSLSWRCALHCPTCQLADARWSCVPLYCIGTDSTNMKKLTVLFKDTAKALSNLQSLSKSGHWDCRSAGHKSLYFVLLTYFHIKNLLFEFEFHLLNLCLPSSADHCISAIWRLCGLVGIWSAALWNAGRTGDCYTHRHTLTHTQWYFLCNCLLYIVVC